MIYAQKIASFSLFVTASSLFSMNKSTQIDMCKVNKTISKAILKQSWNNHAEIIYHQEIANADRRFRVDMQNVQREKIEAYWGLGLSCLLMLGSAAFTTAYVARGYTNDCLSVLGFFCGYASACNLWNGLSDLNYCRQVPKQYKRDKYFLSFCMLNDDNQKIFKSYILPEERPVKYGFLGIKKGPHAFYNSFKLTDPEKKEIVRERFGINFDN